MTDFHFEEGEVFLIDKPLDWTSFDVVNLIRAVIKNENCASFSFLLPSNKPVAIVVPERDKPGIVAQA